MNDAHPRSRTSHWVRRFAILFLLLLAAGSLTFGWAWWYFHPQVSRNDGIVYGYRNDKPLMMDVIRPANANGHAVALMASGGWKSSSPGTTPIWLLAPVLRRGYTVFAIYHVSQPEATVMEIIDDAHRGLRFVRHHATDYGIDPHRIGVTGGSAGGHLSLMLATCGGPGPADAESPIDRESSAVQAVAIFYPVTDLLNLGSSTENLGDGGPPKSYVKAFGPQATNLEHWRIIGRQCSPIYHLTDQLPPTLIYHGDADTLTPLEQSKAFQKQAARHGREVQLVVHSGGAHGWPSMIWDTRKFADWFDKYLRSDTNPNTKD